MAELRPPDSDSGIASGRGSRWRINIMQDCVGAEPILRSRSVSRSARPASRQSRGRKPGSQSVSRAGPGLWTRVSAVRLSQMSQHQLPRARPRPRPAPASLSASDPELTSSSGGETSPGPDTTAVTHTYVASRGQREREVEIYEVLPTVILLARYKQHILNLTADRRPVGDKKCVSRMG